MCVAQKICAKFLIMYALHYGKTPNGRGNTYTRVHSCDVHAFRDRS